MRSPSWTLLSRAYAKHQRAGVFLFGESENTDESYPSIVAAVRSPARRTAREDVETTPTTTTNPVTDPGTMD